MIVRRSNLFQLTPLIFLLGAGFSLLQLTDILPNRVILHEVIVLLSVSMFIDLLVIRFDAFFDLHLLASAPMGLVRKFYIIFGNSFFGVKGVFLLTLISLNFIFDRLCSSQEIFLLIATLLNYCVVSVVLILLARRYSIISVVFKNGAGLALPLSIALVFPVQEQFRIKESLNAVHGFIYSLDSALNLPGAVLYVISVCLIFQLAGILSVLLIIRVRPFQNRLVVKNYNQNKWY